MKYETGFSKIRDFDDGLMHTIRGEKLSTILTDMSFSSGIFFLLSGRKPSDVEAQLFDAILLSVIDHGMATPSSMATRYVASGRTGLSSAVAAGMLSIGNYHGGAMHKAMEQYAQWHSTFLETGEEALKQEISSMILNKDLIYGFGHKVYKKGDPRVREIISLMDSLSYSSQHVYLKNLVEECFLEVKGKLIPMNVDGLIALLLLDFGFDPRVSSGIFLIGRCPGLVMQAYEEMVYEKPVRRVAHDDVVEVDRS